MRNREEIMEDNRRIEERMLEVLLDIRDSLKGQPAPKKKTAPKSNKEN